MLRHPDGRFNMEIHLSLGVSTIVALMADDRTAARQDGRENLAPDDVCAGECGLKEAAQSERPPTAVCADVRSRNVTAKQKDRAGLQE
jgi:hypothetical protein